MNSSPEWIACHPVWWSLWNAFYDFSISHERKYQIIKIIPRERKVETTYQFFLTDSCGKQDTMEISFFWSVVSRVSSWAIKWKNFRLFRYSCHALGHIWRISFCRIAAFHKHINSQMRKNNNRIQTNKTKQKKRKWTQPKMCFLMQTVYECIWCSDTPDRLLASCCLPSQSLVLAVYLFSKG